MKLLIVDNRITEKCERALLLRGFTLLKLPSHKRLSQAICSHPDTLIFRLGNRIITSAEYCEDAAWIFSDLREYAPDVKISFTSDSLGEKYPADCLFNALTVKNKLFAKADTLCPAIKELAEKMGYEICHVKQGYPACSVLAFGNSAITADVGMAEALTKNGIKVSLIRPGFITLPPHEYGFIGGASGVYEKNVYFFGDVRLHPDFDKIKKAIEDEGFEWISLSVEPLADFGGFIAP